MRWLETIHLRTTKLESDRLMSTMHQLINEARKEKSCEEVKMFKRALINTDVSLHLHHDTMQTEPNGSPIGLRIAYALRVFGMVKHSVWVMSEAVSP